MSRELSNLSDNQLIAVVRDDKNGKAGKDAVSMLISRYLKLILKRANTYSDHCSDVEDLTQEGMLAFYKAVDSFDFEKGAKFSSYADVCVTNRIKTIAAGLAKLNAERADEDPAENEIAVSEESPEKICVDKENSINFNKEIFSVLAPMEIKVFELYLDGMSYKNMAEHLGVSEKSVDNAVFRIRKKLKNLLLT